MIKAKIKAPYSLEPALKGDIGHDVYAQEDITIAPMQTVSISTGVYAELPPGVEIQVRPKSGLSSKGLLVHFGTIDNGYRGEILVTVTNLNTSINYRIRSGTGVLTEGLIDNKPYTIKKGDKIAQLVFKKYELVEIEEVDEIESNTERGEKGFGSTGDR